MTDTQTPALTPENDVILQVKDLQVEYRTDDATIYAVNGVDLTVRRNMTVGLVGETGAGKTTTALSIMNRPINQIVFLGPYSIMDERSHLRESFTLRCFQRLSRPYIATQLCPWQDNWCTRGTSIPVLSY